MYIDSQLIFRFDGLEYRILLEITKPWTIEHKKCDISNTIVDPWSTVLHNINNGSSDLAMCSVWLNLKSATYYDVTNHIDYQCGTFLGLLTVMSNSKSW